MLNPGGSFVHFIKHHAFDCKDGEIIGIGEERRGKEEKGKNFL